MSRTTVIPLFPQTPNTQVYAGEVQDGKELTSEYYSRACARTREAERDRRLELADIGQYYCDTFGAAKLPPVARRDCEAALDAGIDCEVILIAIDEAAMAPRPSWAYASAILRRLKAEGVQTPEEYASRQARWEARRRRREELPF